MNLTLNNESVQTMDLNKLFFVFIVPSLSLPTFLLTLFTLFILFKLSREAAMFAYLKLESLFILIDLFIFIIVPILKYPEYFPGFNPNISKIFSVVLVYNMAGVLEMSSCLMAIVAVLGCHSILEATNKSHVYSIVFRLNPNLLALITFGISILNFSYQYFQFKIVVDPNSNSTSHFHVDNTEFQQSVASKILFIISFSISNCFLIFLLVIVNFVTLAKLRKKLNNPKSSSTNKRDRMEKKMTKLILIDSFVVFFGRIPLFVYFVLNAQGKLFSSNIPWSGMANSLMIVSFFLKFFIFYSFNKRFKTETIRACVYFKQMLTNLRKLCDFTSIH